MRRDVLAAGGHSAQFAGGYGDNDVTRNLYKGEDESPVISVVEKEVAPKKVFRPLGETILVRRAEAKTPNGIFIPDSVQKDKPAEGEVLAVGFQVTTVNVGEHIAFGRYAGAEYPLNGETLLLMNITDVLGVLEDEKDFNFSAELAEDFAKLHPKTQIGSA